MSGSLVLKFAWRYHVLGVDEFDSPDEAVASAYYGADQGYEALDHIEVFEAGQPPRVLTPAEVDDLQEPLREAERASWSSRPTPAAMIEIADSDGKWARYSAYSETAQALAAAEEFRDVIGDERVRIMPLKNGLVAFGDVEPIG